jgi:hypothetical protein
MRGWDARSEALFSYLSCEARVPKDHPLRPIRHHSISHLVGTTIRDKFSAGFAASYIH